MSYVFFYHSETESAVARVDIFTRQKTYRKKFAGYDVSGSVDKFSAAAGESSASSSRHFDERDNEERAVRFYLMRAPLIDGMRETTEATYRDRLDEYRKQHAARTGQMT